jgi:hypothetical protein
MVMSDPMLDISIHLLLPLGSHINEIDLKMVSKRQSDDWLLGTNAVRNNGLLLQTCIAAFTKNLHKFCI